MVALRHGIEIDMETLAEVCRRYQVRELSLFGSVLRDDFRDDSDIDVLVEFDPRARIGLFRYFDLETELGAVFGRDVDLITKGGLKWVIRDEIISSAEVVYAV